MGMSTDREARLREERWWPSLSLEDEWWREELELELLLLLLDLEEDLWDEDLEEEEEDLCDEEDDDLCEDDEDECFSLGTSRMLSSRPVVGSVVEVTLGLWATW